MLYEAANADEALAFIQGDPFYDAGVWEDITVVSFKPSIFASEKFIA